MCESAAQFAIKMCEGYTLRGTNVYLLRIVLNV